MDQPARFAAAGWHVQQVDGHDMEAVADAIERARHAKQPSLIACRTTIGKGAPNLGGSEKTHGAPLGDVEVAATRQNICWAYAPFEVPDDIVSAWRDAAERGKAARRAWEKRLAISPQREVFERAVAGKVPDAVFEALDAFRREHVEKATKVATRKASEMALGAINGATDLTVGGSADLTHSNLTITKGMNRVAPGDYAGSYMHYGIREHAMAAAMNGIADRASGDAEGDAEPQRLASCRHHRDGGMLGIGAEERGAAERAGALAPKPADAQASA
jgi:transketolase